MQAWREEGEEHLWQSGNGVAVVLYLVLEVSVVGTWLVECCHMELMCVVVEKRVHDHMYLMFFVVEKSIA